MHSPRRLQHLVSVRSGEPTLTSLMRPFQWCNGESPDRWAQVQVLSQVSRCLGWPKRHPGALRGSAQRAVRKVPFTMLGIKGVWKLVEGQGHVSPVFPAFVWRSISSTPARLCELSNSVLCCGGWRIKSALGLGSPRGSSSFGSETLHAILNMYTVQCAGQGAG